MYNKKTSLIGARLDVELIKKLDFICNHLGIERSEALRQALKDWLNEQMWRVSPKEKLKDIFLEKEVKK